MEREKKCSWSHKSFISSIRALSCKSWRSTCWKSDWYLIDYLEIELMCCNSMAITFSSCLRSASSRSPLCSFLGLGNWRWFPGCSHGSWPFSSLSPWSCGGGCREEQVLQFMRWYSKLVLPAFLSSGWPSPYMLSLPSKYNLL